jgi:hypothetical protein
MAPFAAHATPVPAPTITVVTSVAPNAFGSPSYSAYVANAVGALHDGDATRGDPTSPTYYAAQSNVQASQVIVTSFPSWLGKADPGANFGPNFANELGNRMLFGIKIDGNGGQFAIDQLSFTAQSNDPGDALGFGFGVGSYTYSADYEGVLAGADHTLWTSDDVFVTSGPADQLVDGLVGRGSGNSFANDPCVGCTVAEQQAAIDAVANDPAYPTQFTGTYSLGAATGSGTFNISGSVPEPSTWALSILGLGFAGGMLRRRRAASALQTA